MAIFVSPDRKASTARCRKLREQLADFAADRLDAAATDEMRSHLLDCQSCGEAFAALLLDQVVAGEIPLMRPSSVPVLPRFEAEPKIAALTRFGTRWEAVRDRLSSADARSRAWARDRLEEIRVGVSLLVNPPLTARVQGAPRRRQAGRPAGKRATSGSLVTIRADVLSSTRASRAVTVLFDVVRAPELTLDGHFVTVLRTAAADYDDRIVLCTIELPKSKPVSFSGRLTRVERQHVRELRIDEADVPGPARTIPLRYVTLTILPE